MIEGLDAMVEDVELVHQPPEFSDDRLALAFSKNFADELRYTATLGKWRRWDGTSWALDTTLKVWDSVRETCRAASAGCKTPQLARKIASAQTVAAVERLARSDGRHASTIEQWDADLWKLNTPSGTIDLKTGELLPHDRLHYMTKITAVGPTPTDCPKWLAFLDRITAGDVELRNYLQRVIGYCLTGVTVEHALFFLFGTGANGKSVFVSTIAGILGDYSTTASMETFMVTRGDQHPTGQAALLGARLVTATETEANRGWAESKIKTLTGGDRIAARFMRQDFFNFTPQFKLLIAGNHKPSLRSVDEAMRRRLFLIPFQVTVPVAERDKNLTENLRAEWPAILQWAVDGALAWQKGGLQPPKAVLGATEEYFASEDSIGRWLDESCVQGKDLSAKSSGLFENYKTWCDKNREHAMTQRKFSQALTERGFIADRNETARFYVGLALAEDVPILKGGAIRGGLR